MSGTDTGPVAWRSVAMTGRSRAITPSTWTPVACAYIARIAVPLHEKSAVAFTDCQRRLGEIDPKTLDVPDGTATGAGALKVRSPILPVFSTVNRPSTA